MNTPTQLNLFALIITSIVIYTPAFGMNTSKGHNPPPSFVAEMVHHTHKDRARSRRERNMAYRDRNTAAWQRKQGKKAQQGK